MFDFNFKWEMDISESNRSKGSITEKDQQTKSDKARHSGKSSSIKKSIRVNKNRVKEIKIDPNYVTLTQEQLDTILNLVKTKQEIDLAKVMGSTPDAASEASNEPDDTPIVQKFPIDDSDASNKSENIANLLQQKSSLPDAGKESRSKPSSHLTFKLLNLGLGESRQLSASGLTHRIPEFEAIDNCARQV